MEYRRRLIPTAQGQVLEIGVGPGFNLPLYGPAVDRIIALEPSPKLLAMAGRMTRGLSHPIELLEASAESLPMEDRTIDTVVSTWTLCSIPDVTRALDEMRRVLKPSGRLVFVEHGLSPDASVCRWQQRLTPVWKRLAGGCHLNRPIETLLAEAGFRLERIEHSYMKGPKPLAYMYEGSARVR